MCVYAYYISVPNTMKADFYLADIGATVTNRKTVTQLAIKQPTIACPAADTGRNPTYPWSMLRTARAIENCTVLDLRLFKIISIVFSFYWLILAVTC